MNFELINEHDIDNDDILDTDSLLINAEDYQQRKMAKSAREAKKEEKRRRTLAARRALEDRAERLKLMDELYYLGDNPEEDIAWA